MRLERQRDGEREKVEVEFPNCLCQQGGSGRRQIDPARQNTSDHLTGSLEDPFAASVMLCTHTYGTIHLFSLLLLTWWDSRFSCRRNYYCLSCPNTSLMRCCRAWRTRPMRKKSSSNSSTPCTCTAMKTSGQALKTKAFFFFFGQLIKSGFDGKVFVTCQVWQCSICTFTAVSCLLTSWASPSCPQPVAPRSS